MVKYVWGYVFKEIIDENSRLDIVKSTRFAHDFKLDNADYTFGDALVWYLSSSIDELPVILSNYDVKIELREKHPGRNTKKPSTDCDSILVSHINACILDMIYRPYVHIVFYLSLKKESVSSIEVVKKNAIDFLMGKNRKLPPMIPCKNFTLSQFKNYQPLQETFNNINDFFINMGLGHRYNEECGTYGREKKGKFLDTTRRKGFGHTFQHDLAVFCVKIGPHFRVLELTGVKIPVFVKELTVIRNSAETQIDVQDLHFSVLTVKSSLSVKKIPWVVSDGSPWDKAGIRDIIQNLLDSTDSFCIRRFKKKEQMQDIRNNLSGRDKFSKNFKVFSIEMSNLRKRQLSRHSMLASKLRNIPAWSIFPIDDSVIMSTLECNTLSNDQKISKRREWWRLIYNERGTIYLNNITGTIIKYEVNKHTVMCFCWRSDLSLPAVELKKNDSEMNGRLWSEFIPNYITNKNASEIVRNISARTDISKFC